MLDDSDDNPRARPLLAREFWLVRESSSKSSPDHALRRLGLPPLFEGRDLVRCDVVIRYLRDNGLDVLPSLRCVPAPPVKKKRRAPARLPR